LNSHVGLHADLALGRRELAARFHSSPPYTFRAGEILVAAVRSSDAIHHLQGGWACQFRDLPDGRRAIVDIYLPGDVIGLDAALRIRPLEEVMTLTSLTIETINTANVLSELMACRPTALYIAWLLGQRQRRADRFLAAVSCLDARERLAMMVLDFYTRLRRRKLIASSAYNLPLTQIHIGSYLGLTVAHVNRVLRSLRDEGIVNLEKHCVTISISSGS
jgi:CRP/FNR family transcriptional regulator